MDGKQSRLAVVTMMLAAMFNMQPVVVLANDKAPDLDMLEWLGKTLEARELGVDIDALLETQSGVSQKNNSNSPENDDENEDVNGDKQ